MERHEFTVDPESAGLRLDVYLAGLLPAAFAVAAAAPREGRPGDARRPGREAERDAQGRRRRRHRDPGRGARDAGRAGPRTSRSSTRTPTSSSSTSRPAWSCTRRPGTTQDTLVNALLFHADNLSGVGGEQRPGIVHRLDRGHVGADGRRQERRGAPRADPPVPRPRGREGVRRAGVGRRARGPAHRPAGRPGPRAPGEDVDPRAPGARRRSRASPRRATCAASRSCTSRSPPAARTRSACT